MIQAEVEKSQITRKINNKNFCIVFSYLYHYHRAVAKVSRISIKSLNFVENTEATGGADLMRNICSIDEDQLIMFKMVSSVKPLGIRGDIQYDIEFPTRNQLKVFLAQHISKYRAQQRRGVLDTDSKEH